MDVRNGPVIATERLTKRYGRHRGLDGLDLEVARGEVFGFLGPNGAGKSTTIRLLLDLIRPTSGRVAVFGQDPRVGGPELRARIGYLAGDFVTDPRQTVRETLQFLANLQGGVPAGRITRLAERLDLDLRRRVRGLSKGNRQKVGLVQAFMHSPELLILDEPTSGLDPLVQQEFLAMVREARAAGQTVFMSSHVMSEVQQTADRVGIIREGRLLTVERIDTLRERAVRSVEVQFTDPPPVEVFARIPGVHEVSVTGAMLRCRLAGSADELIKAVAGYPVVTLLVVEPALEELFLTYYAEGAVTGAA